MKTKKPRGRPPRSKTLERKTIVVKLTLDEYKTIEKLAKEFDGNMNKMFRVLVLGEKR